MFIAKVLCRWWRSEQVLRSPTRKSNNKFTRLRVEPLEDRTTPAVVSAVINGPPTAPTDTSGSLVHSVPVGAVMLSQVPTSTWTYGCSATSAGMIFGYYDRHAFPNMYAGPANGGVAPLTDLGQGDNPLSPIAGACSIIATMNGFDGRATPGHVDDYWISYNSPGPDPWVGAGVEHTWGDCTADYMGTNQWRWDFDLSGSTDANRDGFTTYFFDTTGAKLHDFIPVGYGLPQTELTHGMRLFAESRGYTVVQNYTQITDNVNPAGFTFVDYMAEIDAGRPMMIQVTNHSMVGVGYDAATSTIYLHDTWDNNVHQMTWGTSYTGLAMEAITVIELQPPVNSPPVVNDQTFAAAENSAAGTVVGVVAASDPDAGDTRSFTITGGNTGGAFTINAATGQLRVNNPATLDFEANPVFSLTVQVTDAGSLTDTATVTVNLTNVNEPPVVNDQAFTMAENSAAGTVVGAVAASDPDSGDSPNFAITGGNAGGAFAIDLVTGQLTVSNPAALDFEANPVFSLTVQITDGGGLTDTATVTVNLGDVNESPAVDDQTFTMAENVPPGTVPVGTVVGAVTASDPDTGDARSFAILGGNTGGAFAINAATGQLTVSNPAALDFEANPVFSLTVQVTDGGGLTDTATITVNLTNVVRPMTLHGTLYEDFNANGVRDPGEGPALDWPVRPWSVYLDLNNNGALDAGEPSTPTDATGAYRFGNVASGTSHLLIRLLPGDIAISHPAGQLVAVTADEDAFAEDMGVRHQLTVVPTRPIATIFHPGQGADAAEDTVMALYRAVLGREAEAGGLATHAAALRQFGAKFVASALWNSAEHRAMQVENYYRVYLGRSMDAAAQVWVNALLAGQGEQSVVAGILSSEEFAALHSGNDEFVRALYPLLLGREVVDGEHGSHVAALDAGLSRAVLVSSILRNEQEVRMHDIDSLFSTVLERDGDASGMASWTQALASGQSLADIAYAMLSSDEFQLRAHA